MPFVRVSLKTGKSQEFKRGLSQVIHEALVHAFKIPEDDIFQVIDEVNSENIIYPESYLGISHSNDIIYIQITAKSGRTVAMKKDLYHQIAQNLKETLGHPTNDTFITLVENSEENWSFGNGKAQLVS